MTKSLLTVFIAALLVCPAGPGRAADAGNATAYEALRVMGKSLGSDTISRVVEVTGRNGAPQPTTWRIVISEGVQGTREIKIAGGRLVSQKVFTQPTTLKPIRLQDLNLDSSGAFDAANLQARKAKVPFAALNYALRVSETSGKPVWDLELMNQTGTHVGGVRLAAHDGDLIAVTGLTPRPSTTVRPYVATSSTDHDSVRPTHVSPSRDATVTTTTTTSYNTVQAPPPAHRNDEDVHRDSSAPQANEGGFFSRAGRTLDHTTDAVGDTMNRTGRSVDQTMRHTGATLQRFFTGHGDPDQNNTGAD